MTKYLKIIIIAIGMFSFTGVAAQQKIGHINADKLLQMMPETKEAQKKLEEYGKQLEKDLTDMQTELETKVTEFRSKQDSYTNLAIETKTQEIQELQRRIQSYNQRAQEDLQNKQVELFDPIIQKATNAVKEVAEENGFAYILDSSESKAVVIYAGGGEDVMPLVKKKLGITE